MPSSISELLAAAGLSKSGVVRWGQPAREYSCGVYLVALTDRLVEPAGCITRFPVSLGAVREWLSVRAAEFTLDGRTAPNPAAVIERLAQFWLSNETVLYIGQTGRPLGKRIGEFYETPLGAKRPHAGGHWIQTLAVRDQLYVHYAATDSPGEAETAMLERFCANIAPGTLALLRDPDHPYPFANLEWPKGHPGSFEGRKNHGMGGQREP